MKTTHFRGFPSGDAATVAPMIETMTPARAPDIRADFLTPAAQSLFSGFVGGATGAIGAWRVWDGDVLTWACAGFVAALGVSWVVSLGLVRDLLWTVERITQKDLDDDKHVGKPETGHALIENPGKARNQAAELARETAGRVHTAELLTFVTRCAAVGTSENKLGIPPNPNARAKYAELRDVLIQLGIGKWRDHERRRLGWELALTPEQAAPIIRQHVKTLRNPTN